MNQYNGKIENGPNGNLIDIADIDHFEKQPCNNCKNRRNKGNSKIKTTLAQMIEKSEIKNKKGREIGRKTVIGQLEIGRKKELPAHDQEKQWLRKSQSQTIARVGPRKKTILFSGLHYCKLDT